MGFLLWIAIGGLFMLSIASGVCSSGDFISDRTFGMDLRLRRNEILCAHEGVNSFHIWNHEIVHDGFKPLWRPDCLSLKGSEGDREVHAYPAWHTFFFYFYGWIPEVMCIGLMALCYGVCGKYIFEVIFKEANAITSCGGMITGLVLAVVSFAITRCYMLLNYGTMLAALFLLMRNFIHKNRQICAGVCWALMMIKPQVGLLFFWPLFWRKKYKTMIIAITICVFACCVTAFIFRENPINLILQIPKIGKPYGKYIIVDAFLGPIFGEAAGWLWMGAVFVLCALLSYWTKDVRDFLVSSAPIAIFIPIWTYSQQRDGAVLVGWYFATAICALHLKCWRMYWAALILVAYFTCGWSLLCSCDILNPAGKGWVYRLVTEGLNLITVFASIMFSWKIYKKKIREAWFDTRLRQQDIDS